MLPEDGASGEVSIGQGPISASSGVPLLCLAPARGHTLRSRSRQVWPSLGLNLSYIHPEEVGASLSQMILSVPRLRDTQENHALS